ncbi:ABC transporter substrate-binding protein [Bordetella bronchialis]
MNLGFHTKKPTAMSAFFRPSAWRAWRLALCALLCAGVALLSAPPAAATGAAKTAAGARGRPPAQPAAPPPLRIGEINTYKALPAFAQPYRQGWMLALEQINAEGGVLGRKLEVRSRDDHGVAEDAVAAARTLVEKDGVAALFGGYSSEASLAISRYADTDRVPYLAVAPLTQRLTWQEGNAYTFRLRPGAWMQAAAVAPKALGLRKLRWALVYQDTESDRATAEAFKGLMKTFQSKTEFVAEQAVAPGRFDAKATVAAVAEARPEALFNMLTGAELAALARAGAAAHLFDGMGVVSLFTGDPENIAALDDAIAKDAPAAGAGATPEPGIPDGWIVTGYPRDAVDTPENQAFVQAYRERYGDAPGMASVLGYSALRSIAEALKRAGTPDRDAVAAAFRRLQVPTPFGTIEYRNLDHQATLGIFLGYTGHADGRLVMDRFVYATGARLQPLDEQIRRLRVQAGRASAAAAGPAPLAKPVAGAAQTDTAGSPAAAGKPEAPPTAGPARPVVAPGRPATRPDTALNARLSAAKPGASPAGGPAAPANHADPAQGGGAAAAAQAPFDTSRSTRAVTPAMADWPDQVHQPAAR